MSFSSLDKKEKAEIINIINYLLTSKYNFQFILGLV